MMISRTSCRINGLVPIIPEKVINRFCFLAACMRPKLLVVYSVGRYVRNRIGSSPSMCVFNIAYSTPTGFAVLGCNSVAETYACLFSRGITMYSLRS
jgi:hypothetical protein